MERAAERRYERRRAPAARGNPCKGKLSLSLNSNRVDIWRGNVPARDRAHVVRSGICAMWRRRLGRAAPLADAKPTAKEDRRSCAGGRLDTHSLVQAAVETSSLKQAAHGDESDEVVALRRDVQAASWREMWKDKLVARWSRGGWGMGRCVVWAGAFVWGWGGVGGGGRGVGGGGRGGRCRSVIETMGGVGSKLFAVIPPFRPSGNGKLYDRGRRPKKTY